MVKPTLSRLLTWLFLLLLIGCAHPAPTEKLAVQEGDRKPCTDTYTSLGSKR